MNRTFFIFIVLIFIFIIFHSFYYFKEVFSLLRANWKSKVKRIFSSSANWPLEHAKLAFVSANIGGYEKTAKEPVRQSIPADFIVYTDNPKLLTHGVWKIYDAESYSFGMTAQDRNSSFKNSLSNNRHSFNRAKFFKLNLHRLPELDGYDIIVWVDGTIQIDNPQAASIISNLVHEEGRNFIVFEHERNGSIIMEAAASHFHRYTDTHWNNQNQPYQDIDEQVTFYLQSGYDRNFFGVGSSTSQFGGMWVTNFVAYDMSNPQTFKFLDEWWLQNLIFTTQDQISFPYSLWKHRILPYTLPSKNITGNFNQNKLFHQLPHGQ